MSSLWDLFENETRKEVYERELRANEADEKEQFEVAGTLYYVLEEDNGSEVMCEGKDGNCYILHTNKSVSYWYGMEGQEVFLRGTLLKNGEVEKFMVFHAIPCDNGEGLKKFTDDQLLKFENVMKFFTPDLRRILYSKLGEVETWDEYSVHRNSLSISSEIEELEVMFAVMKHLLPKDVVDEIQRCMNIVNSSVRSLSEKGNCRKTIYYLLSYPWWGEDIACEVRKVQEHMDNTHVALSHTKSEFLKEMVGVNASEEKKPRIILLVGPSGSGKTTLAHSFFSAMGKKYAELNLAGIKDEVLLAGAGKEYENGRPGNIFLRLHYIGNGGGLILDNIDQTNLECMDVLSGLLDEKFVDHFLMVPVDKSKVWIVMTANNIDDVNPIFMERVHKVIHMDEYTEEEKCEIINQVLIPRYGYEYGMKTNEDFSKDVCKEVIRYAAGKSIKAIAQIVQDIFLSAKQKGEEFPQISTRNFQEYYSLGDMEKIKSMYATSYVEFNTKASACYGLYPESVQKRNHELLEMLIYGTESDKAYAKKALTVTTNILHQQEKDIDIEDVRKELDKSHYGMEEVKKAICRNVAARKIVKDSKIKVLLLDGAAGVGKTSIARTIAKALGRPFVKISLNGISDLEELKGSYKSCKDAESGLIPKNLAKEGVGSYHAVVLLDEVDKLGQKEFAGLYDILDPDNGGYYDNYLECFMETKHIIFILTSNNKEKIPPSILDRCEVIEVGGYSMKQKKCIVRDYVIPNLASRYQLETIQMTEDANDLLLGEYCGALGVRDAERAMEKIVETKLLSVKENKIPKYMNIDVDDVKTALSGETNRNNEMIPVTGNQCGNARALAVAGNYGVWFDIQVTSNEYGEENVKVTGLAQGSFAESIDVAKTLVCNRMKNSMPKIHLHTTSEGIAKDGPSAGLTIFSCLMSYMKKIPLPNVAFTGVVDLFGNVKKIGGADLKLKAAERAGVETVYMPRENFEELRDCKELEYHDVRVVPITHVDEIVKELFEKGA